MNRKWIEVKEAGQLYLEKILVTFDIPILFVCTDDRCRRYLCLCVDEEIGQYVIVRTDDKTLLQMLGNEITMEQVFRNSSDTVMITEYHFDSGRVEVHTENAADVPEDLLPEVGAYLELDNHNIQDYIKELREQSVVSKTFVLDLTAKLLHDIRPDDYTVTSYSIPNVSLEFGSVSVYDAVEGSELIA